MKPHRKKRLYMILVILLGVTLSASLAIYALGQNMNLYFTPSQAIVNKAPTDKTLRIGGLVKEGSVKRDSNSLKVNFTLTDHSYEIPVQYTGILPALFREGQGIVAQGKLNVAGVLIADQVLAKHDEKYMPPNISAVREGSE
ncbi:MAG: cytochrome c-type biosis protein CcmE [Gammaproteobacteria bacterium]|jgi:cytochrome c-type biogenesis protein CcmE|nr:cytochrome c-type biosis protein CcmE [Gammaproteobacteria bacterium]